MTWDGDSYQARFDERAASGADVHGEADLVAALRPLSVLDVGCGTGRVARELAARGVDVVGVDADASMIATARRLGPALEWQVADMCGLALDRVFDVVLMAGNVPLFTAPGTEAALVAACAPLRSVGRWCAVFSWAAPTISPPTTSTAALRISSSPDDGRPGIVNPSRAPVATRCLCRRPPA